MNARDIRFTQKAKAAAKSERLSLVGILIERQHLKETSVAAAGTAPDWVVKRLIRLLRDWNESERKVPL